MGAGGNRSRGNPMLDRKLAVLEVRHYQISEYGELEEAGIG